MKIFSPSTWRPRNRITVNAIIIGAFVIVSVVFIIAQRGNPAVTLISLGMSAAGVVVAKVLAVFVVDEDVSEEGKARLKFISAMCELNGAILAVPVALAAIDAAFWQAVAGGVAQ